MSVISLILLSSIQWYWFSNISKSVSDGTITSPLYYLKLYEIEGNTNLVGKTWDILTIKDDDDNIWTGIAELKEGKLWRWVVFNVKNKTFGN